MNILLINHYAGSPSMGMEYRPYYLAQEWIKSGHSVTILVANNSHIRTYNPILKKDFVNEIIDGITYKWVKTPSYNGNGLGRIKNIFKFVQLGFKYRKQIVDEVKPDVVIASSTYPSDNYLAKKIADLSGAKYVYEVHDLWPLSPMELGGMSKYHPFIMLMQHGENFAYRKANKVISMLPKTKEHMKNHGLDLSKWSYIPNGVCIDDWSNQEPLNNDLLSDLLEFKKTHNVLVAYTGTFGVANALYTLLDSAKILAKNKIGFVLLGKGPELQKLKGYISVNKLSNVLILSAIDKKQIPSFLTLCDILYIGLQRQPLFRFGISPNKLIDYMMASKPIIQAINAGNNVVKDVGCGIDVEPENPEAIAEAILKLKSLSKEELNHMGSKGKEFVLKNHDYKVLAKKFIDVIS